jgi:hypothetical protein
MATIWTVTWSSTADASDGDNLTTGVTSRAGSRRVRARVVMGAWVVRVLSVIGVALILLSVTGWWLTTRVTSDNGFADVVTGTLQREAVRDYIADQATLQFAGTSTVLTAARPVVAKALSEVLDDPAVIAAVRSFVVSAHHQVFAVNATLRANASASAAAVSIRSTLQSINPSLAEKLPDSVLYATASLSQNEAIDVAAHASTWVAIFYIPIGVLGLALLVFVLMKAREPVRAVRFAGFALAIAGALPIGLGAATPVFGALGGNVDPGRGGAVASFVNVLLSRLVAAGWVILIVGLLIAFTPGRDSAGLWVRLTRSAVGARQWVVQQRWRRIGVCLIVIAAAAVLVNRPTESLRWVAPAFAATAIFGALIALFTSLDVLRPDTPVRPIRRRQVAGVIAAVIVCAGLTTTATSAVVVATNQPHRANPRADGCNGSVELCMQPLNQILWAGSHNAMSSTAYGFYSAEHTLTIPEQLNQGATALLIDAYYGYRQGSLVRTNLAGGASHAQVEADFGKSAADELARLGALTGTASLSSNKKDVYLCHDYCELGAIKASTVFSQINDFLNRNLTDVLILDVEDYVQPADLEKALKLGNLWDRVYTPDLSKPLPTLLDLVTPPAGQDQAQRRIIVTSENNAGKAPWLLGTYQLMQETPYTFSSISQFNCDPNRGQPGNPMFLVNHWLRTGGQPNPTAAATVNSQATLTARLQQCIRQRGRLPNIIAVDFFGLGDTMTVVDQINAAVAELTGTTAFWDQAIANARANPDLTLKASTQLDQLQRLPTITAADARALLGPIADKLHAPDFTADLARINAESGADDLLLPLPKSTH